MRGPLYQSCHCSQWGLWSVRWVAVSPGCLPTLVSRLWGSVVFWYRSGGAGQFRAQCPASPQRQHGSLDRRSRGLWVDRRRSGRVGDGRAWQTTLPLTSPSSLLPLAWHTRGPGHLHGVITASTLSASSSAALRLAGAWMRRCSLSLSGVRPWMKECGGCRNIFAETLKKNLNLVKFLCEIAS